MLGILRRTAVNATEDVYSVFKQSKRFAGHSKWQNIRHTKAENDAERSALFNKLVQQMKIAIAEGGNAKPAENIRLSQVIEIAKKKCMPNAKINSVLEKAVSSPSKKTKLEVRGPGGTCVVIDLITDNLKALRPLLNNVFKKYNITVVDNHRSVFKHQCLILTEHKGDIDSATDDAILVGAEEVEETNIDGHLYWQFTCGPLDTSKVMNLLGKQGYNIISSEELYTPNVYINLTDEDSAKLEKFYEKLRVFSEVATIYDNTAEKD